MRPGPRGGDVGVAAKSLWTGAARARQGIRPAAAHRRLRRVATSEDSLHSNSSATVADMAIVSLRGPLDRRSAPLDELVALPNHLRYRCVAVH